MFLNSLLDYWHIVKVNSFMTCITFLLTELWDIFEEKSFFSCMEIASSKEGCLDFTRVTLDKNQLTGK